MMVLLRGGRFQCVQLVWTMSTKDALQTHHDPAEYEKRRVGLAEAIFGAGSLKLPP